MRLARRLLVATVAAVIVLALAAASSAANEALEVFEEGTGSHCDTPTVTSHMVSGGCQVKIHGEPIERVGHVFGIESHRLVCEYGFDLWIGEDGGGFVTGMVVDDGPAGAHDIACNDVRPCITEGSHDEAHPGTEGNEAGEHVWPFEMEEIGGAGSEEYEAHVTACFHTAESIEECEGQIDFHIYEEHPAAQPEQITEAETVDESGGSHSTHGPASLPEGIGAFATHCELDGHFDLAPEHELHINHLGA